MMSFALATGILLWFNLIQLQTGLFYLGSILILLFIEFLIAFMRYLRKTKFDHYRHLFLTGLFIVVAITSGFPTFTFSQQELQNVPSDVLIETLTFLEDQPAGTVLGAVNEGNLIVRQTNKKNLIDDDFLLIQDSRDRIKDAQFIYTTFSETGALELIEKYKN